VTSSLQFLGTAGARHVVASQARHSGGLVWRVAGATVWVDPGPGALVRALAAAPPLDPAQVTALLLTHRHLDHAGDATAAVEAMTGGGFHARGALYAPADALDEEPVVFRYAQRFPRKVVRLHAGGSYRLAEGLVLETPLAHDHGVETYGYRLSFGGFTAAHVVDTFWMDALPAAYAGVELLIVNTTRRSGRDRRILHLGVDDAERLVAAVRPRLAVLTHFGKQLLAGPPARFARELAERTGVEVLAAEDGLVLPLGAEALDAPLAGR
jgi:ribonuclease BN (tRNA processing enzyme)